MSDELVQLTHGKEEVAFHEAGHGAIEMIAGFTPLLLLIRDAGNQWEGDCYSRAPTNLAQSGWRARKAVAGALSQAKHAAEVRLTAEATIDLASDENDLVAFFLTPPRPGVTCRTGWRAGDSDQAVAVDLAGGYSEMDYMHFRVAVGELAGVPFDASDHACRQVALDAVRQCVSTLADRFVWRHVGQLATALLEAVPVTVQMVGRPEIESAAVMLLDYRPSGPE
jgi:hypothetical protein